MFGGDRKVRLLKNSGWVEVDRKPAMNTCSRMAQWRYLRLIHLWTIYSPLNYYFTSQLFIHLLTIYSALNYLFTSELLFTSEESSMGHYALYKGCSGCFFSDGLLHVGHHSSWSHPGELHLWHTGSHSCHIPDIYLIFTILIHQRNFVRRAKSALICDKNGCTTNSINQYWFFLFFCSAQFQELFYKFLYKLRQNNPVWHYLYVCHLKKSTFNLACVVATPVI